MVIPKRSPKFIVAYDAEKTKLQYQAEFWCCNFSFIYIAFPITSPIVSAASLIMSGVAWV